MVEHLKNNAPQIIAEIRRWRFILWDDYTEEKQRKERERILVSPASIHTLS